VTPRERTLMEVAAIAQIYGLKSDDVLGRCRTRAFSQARQHCYWHFREKGKTYNEIARIMRRKNHTTILYGISCHERRLSLDPVSRLTVADLDVQQA